MLDTRAYAIGPAELKNFANSHPLTPVVTHNLGLCCGRNPEVEFMNVFSWLTVESTLEA
jgi:hypothetical protein